MTDEQVKALAERLIQHAEKSRLISFRREGDEFIFAIEKGKKFRMTLAQIEAKLAAFAEQSIEPAEQKRVRRAHKE